MGILCYHPRHYMLRVVFRMWSTAIGRSLCFVAALYAGAMLLWLLGLLTGKELLAAVGGLLPVLLKVPSVRE